MDLTASNQNKVESLQEELRRVRKENEALRFMLEVTSRKYQVLKERISLSEVQKINNNYYEIDHMVDKNKRARIDHRFPITDKSTTQVFVRTDPKDKSLIVKDGYQWRKYGQKVTKDNPYPRAYFRCSMAPRCAVKKKVQRSTEDKTVVIATYDGQHNHDCSTTGVCFDHHASSLPDDHQSNQDQDPDRDRNDQARSATTSTISTSPSPRPSLTLDLSLSGSFNNNSINQDHDPMIINKSEVDLEDQSTRINNNNNNNNIEKRNISKNKEKYIEDYVTSLTKDRSFTVALAEAVARSIQNLSK